MQHEGGGWPPLRDSLHVVALMLGHACLGRCLQQGNWSQAGFNGQNCCCSVFVFCRMASNGFGLQGRLRLIFWEHFLVVRVVKPKPLPPFAAQPVNPQLVGSFKDQIRQTPASSHAGWFGPARGQGQSQSLPEALAALSSCCC